MRSSRGFVYNSIAPEIGENSTRPALDIICIGASLNAEGAWRFADGSCGRILNRPASVYSDEQMSKKIGLCWFDSKLDVAGEFWTVHWFSASNKPTECS
jgi:hypothetical protein